MGPEAPEGDTADGQGINEPPFLDEAQMEAAVREGEEPFAGKGEEAVAEGGDADGAQVAETQGVPEAAPAVAVEHGCGDERAQQHMERVLGPEEGFRDRPGRPGPHDQGEQEHAADMEHNGVKS